MTRAKCLSILVPFLFALSAHAAWEGKVEASSSTGEFKPMTGTLYQSGSALRIDSNYTMDMTFYGKAGSTRVDAAVPTFFIRLRKDALPVAIPNCLGVSFDACVKEFKMKKTGSERCGDRNCDVYQGSPKIRNVKSVKVWHWSGEKEPILAKAVVTKTNGSVATATFSEVKRAVHSDAFYVVPPNYKDAGPLERWVGDLKGKSAF